MTQRFTPFSGRRLQRLRSDLSAGRGGRREEGHPVRLPGSVPSVLGHGLFEAYGIGVRVHSNPQLHHFTHLGQVTHSCSMRILASLRALFVDSSEARAAIRGTHPPC